jgi:hypothetical protein
MRFYIHTPFTSQEEEHVAQTPGHFTLNVTFLGVTKELLLALITVNVTRGTYLGNLRIFIDKVEF